MPDAKRGSVTRWPVVDDALGSRERLSEPPLAGHVGYVVSVGGHHDLARVLRFLIRN